MATLHFLGTCSGTEPMVGMHHTSTVLEVNGSYYWFDAGENCSYTAYLSGIDVLKTRAIVFSHMHIDHTGGLANLFFCIQKMIALGKGNPAYDPIAIYAPDLEIIRAVKCVASTNRCDSLRFSTEDIQTKDGLLFEDENIRVTALHNRHLGEDGTNGWHSYSFLVECDGKKMILSGDVASPEELLPLMKDGCDLWIMETGHHKVKDVCDFAQAHAIPHLRFTHHGREIIGDRKAAETLIRSYPFDIKLAYDGMTEEI